MRASVYTKPAPGQAETPNWRLLTPLLLGSALNPINSSVIATTLVAVGRAFGVGTAATASLVAALYLASAVGQPAMGKLAEVFGPRRVFLGGLVIVGLGGLLGTVAANLPMLIAARVLLGIGTSAGYPTAMVIIRSWSEGRPTARTGGALGALAVAGQVTAAVGLPLGGLLIALGGWRVTYAMNMPLAVIGLILTLLWVPRDQRTCRTGWSSTIRDLDPGGLILFAGSIASLLYVLSDLEHPNWPVVGVCILLLICFLIWELRIGKPFIDIRLIARNRALSRTYLRVVMTFLLSYTILFGLTQWLVESRGLSAGQTGLVMLPMSVIAIVISLPFARRNMIRSALVLTAVAGIVGAASLMAFTTETPLWVLVAVAALFGIMSGLGMIGNQAALYRQAPAENVGVAAGLMRTFMYLGAILSSGLISVSFGENATDEGLHAIAVVMIVLAAVLLVLTVTGLLRQRRRSRKAS